MKSLADVVSGAGLAVYAEVALLIFFVVFVAVGLRILFSKDYDVSGARLPFEGDAPAPSGDTHANQ